MYIPSLWYFLASMVENVCTGCDTGELSVRASPGGWKTRGAAGRPACFFPHTAPSVLWPSLAAGDVETVSRSLLVVCAYGKECWKFCWFSCLYVPCVRNRHSWNDGRIVYVCVCVFGGGWVGGERVCVNEGGGGGGG